MSRVPLDPFRACIFTAPETYEWAYRSQVAFAGIYCQQSPDVPNAHIPADLVTLICIVVFVLKLKAGHGQSRMTRLMRTILQDGVLYFFVMSTFHIAMVVFAVIGRVIHTFLSLVESCILMSRQPKPSVHSFAPAAIMVYVFRHPG